MKRNVMLAIAAGLIALGVVAFVVQPGPPDPVCVEQGTPSSGFEDSESGCPISMESYEEIADYNSSPKPFRIAGLLLVVIGLAVGVVGLVKGRKGSGEPAPPAD